MEEEEEEEEDGRRGWGVRVGGGGKARWGRGMGGDWVRRVRYLLTAHPKHSD